MTNYGVEMLWIVILASLGLSALAVLLSISRRRDGHAPAVARAGEDVAAEAARKVMREFEKNGQSADAALVTWSPETLRKILADDLPDAQVIVVSNREPYIHNVMDNGVERPIRKVEARDKRIHRLGVGHVQTIDPDGSADAGRLQLTIELAALCEVAHRRHNAPTAFRQFDRRRKADTGRRPGDEDCSHGVQTSVPKGGCARARPPVRGLPRVRPAAWSAVARANKESPCAG